MTQEPKHTPGKWTLREDMLEIEGRVTEGKHRGKKCLVAMACDEKKYLIATPEIGQANANFIVRACNSHNDLLAALEDTLEWFTNKGFINGVHYDEHSVIDQIKAAIAKGESQ